MGLAPRIILVIFDALVLSRGAAFSRDSTFHPYSHVFIRSMTSMGQLHTSNSPEFSGLVQVYTKKFLGLSTQLFFSQSARRNTLHQPRMFCCACLFCSPSQHYQTCILMDLSSALLQILAPSLSASVQTISFTILERRSSTRHDALDLHLRNRSSAVCKSHRTALHRNVPALASAPAVLILNDKHPRTHALIFATLAYRAQGTFLQSPSQCPYPACYLETESDPFFLSHAFTQITRSRPASPAFSVQRPRSAPRPLRPILASTPISSSTQIRLIPWRAAAEGDATSLSIAEQRVAKRIRCHTMPCHAMRVD